MIDKLDPSIGDRDRFVHLRTKTEHSQLNSVVSVKGIGCYVEKEESLAIGMMDDMNLSGAFSFCKQVIASKAKPLIGMNVIVLEDGVECQSDHDSCLGLLAMNLNGYRNLIQIVKKAQFEYGKSGGGNLYVKLSDVLALNGGLICLSGGYHGFIARVLLNGQEDSAIDYCRSLNSVFGDRFYIELTRHGRKEEKKLEDCLIRIAYDLNIPIVATNDVHFLREKNFDAYDALSCVREGTFVSQEGRWRLNRQYYLKSEDEMKDLFSDMPEAIANTVEIARRCSFVLHQHKPMLPSFGDKSEDEVGIFRDFSMSGLEKRLKGGDITRDDDVKIYYDRLEYEMGVIEKMNFVGYFLIVCDFVRWAKSNGIPVGPGRGSGAGSLVAWCLDITNVDPIKYGLIFERFLNPERVSMPDFDIDFCQARRDEVVEYVRKKYGSGNVGSIITFGKLQAKAALKDIGRVLQLPYRQIDEICKLIPFNPIEPVTLSQAIEMDDGLRQEALRDADVQNLIDISLQVEGLNRHSSTHAAGIVISSKPLDEVVPVHKDHNGDLSVVAFDMKDSEAIGLVKFDFLGLKTLSVINTAMQLVRKNRGIDIDIDCIDMHDEKTLQLLQSSRTKGIFQLEATVPREALQRIKVDGVPDISAITSLNRPGPMENIPKYIRRKNGNEVIESPHPLADELLKETYGVIIYQEQVMRMAQIIAGYSLGDADLLRRAMGKKIKAEMDKQESVFIAGALQNNIDKDKAVEIFNTIAKFAGYGFNKSHSIAYSILSYQTAYLKANFMAEFLTAMANFELSNTDKITEVVNDAKLNGIEILLPDINISIDAFVVISTKKIMYGMGALKSVGSGSVHNIVEERVNNGRFVDVFDFVKRCANFVNRKQIEQLIKSGCFDSLHKNRRVLIDAMEEIVKYGLDCRKKTSDASLNQDSLFDDDDMGGFKPPVLVEKGTRLTETELMMQEFDAFGFYIYHNPLLKYQRELKKYGVISLNSLDPNTVQAGSKDILLGGVVTKVRQRSGKKGRFAFLSISDLDGIVEVAIFNDLLIVSRRELLQEGKVLIVPVSMRFDSETGLRLTANDLLDIKDAFRDNAAILKKYKDRSARGIKKKKEDVFGGNIASIGIGGVSTNSDDTMFIKRGKDYIACLIRDVQLMCEIIRYIKAMSVPAVDGDNGRLLIFDNGANKINSQLRLSGSVKRKIKERFGVRFC